MFINISKYIKINKEKISCFVAKEQYFFLSQKINAVALSSFMKVVKKSNFII
jgi:hypothetical protein